MNSFSEDGNFGRDPARPDATAESEASTAVAGPSQFTPEQIRDSISGKFVCPYCGSMNDSEQGACPRCQMQNNAATRKATKSRIGPWYVLQARNPAAPGMKFETLISFAQKGKIRPRSVVRGPTTHQLWKFAAQVKGVSREFGVCYSCGGQIEPTASVCPQCNRSQDPPANPDVLLESKDPAPPPPISRPPFDEPDLSEVDAEFVVPTLGPASDDSVSGVSMTGSMAGVAFNPDTWVPPRRDVPQTDSSRMKVDEGFLSPKDLAAAFNLNFTPNAGAPVSNGGKANVPPARRPVRANRPPVTVARPASVQRMAAFHAKPVDDLPFGSSGAVAAPAKPRSRFRVIKVLSFLILFSAAIGGAAIYSDPAIGAQAQQWWAWLKAEGSKLGSEPTPVGPSRKGTASQAPAAALHANLAPPSSDLSTTVAPQPTVEPLTPQEPTVAPSTDSASAPAGTASQTATQAIVAPSSAPTVAARPMPTVVSSPVTVTPPAQRRVAPAADPSAALTQSLGLYRDALKLESTDPALAIAEYKSIKQLPREVWPSGLDLCIKRAETHLQLPNQ